MIQSHARFSAIFYGWYIVAAAFLVITMSHGLQNSFGVFLKPLSEGFGWSRSLTAGALMLYLSCRGISGIVTGRLTDRYGPRLIVGAGAILMGLGMLLGSIMSSAWQFYVFYGLMVGAGMGVGVVPLTATISRWFVARRGLALGIMGTGSGLANVVAPPLGGYLIRSLGISGAYLVMGAFVMATVGLSALALRKSPQDIGLRPYGEESEQAPGGSEANKGVTGRPTGGWGTLQALRSGTFWLLATVAFIVGIGVFTFTTNIVAHATDLGVSQAMAPYLLSIMGGSHVTGMMVMGVLSERIGIRRTLILGLGIQGTALFLLTGATSFTSLVVISGIFGFGIGGAVLQLLGITAEFFGLRSLGAILWFVWLVELLGGGLGSELGNLIYDLTPNHSYEPAFWLGGSLLIVAIILTTTVMRRRPGQS